MYAYNDEHLGNVLLRKTSKKSLRYGYIELQLEGLYVILMDFEKSIINYSGDIYTRIKKILHLICVSDIVLAYPEHKISKLQSAHTIITKQDYKVINDIIDEITIRYVKSKILRMKVH